MSDMDDREKSIAYFIYTVILLGAMWLFLAIFQNDYNDDSPLFVIVKVIGYGGGLICFSLCLYYYFKNKKWERETFPERIESEKVDKIIQEYNDSSIDDKIKFLAEFPSESYNFAKLREGSVGLRQIQSYMDRNDLSVEEYRELETRIYEIHRDSKIGESIANTIQKHIKKDYDLDSLDTIEYELISASNEDLKSRLKSNKTLLISKNKIMFLGKNINLSKLKYTDSFNVSDLQDMSRYYLDGEYSPKYNVVYDIRIEDVICYLAEGSKTVNTVISGGGSSGSIDPVKAVAMKRKVSVFDNVLPDGDAGAVYSMLSDLKIDPIETRLIERDERVVVLKTKKEDFIFYRETDKNDLYMYFVDKIPEKDLERMKIAENSKEKKNSNKKGQEESKHSNLDEIKKLKELLDMDAITQEEYDKKKKELLK